MLSCRDKRGEDPCLIDMEKLRIAMFSSRYHATKIKKKSEAIAHWLLAN